MAASRVIHVCDREQLGPSVSVEAPDSPLARSLFERLIRSGGGFSSFMLTVQYSMDKHICAWPNQQFYEGRLETLQALLLASNKDILVGDNRQSGTPVSVE